MWTTGEAERLQGFIGEIKLHKLTRKGNESEQRSPRMSSTGLRQKL